MKLRFMFTCVFFEYKIHWIFSSCEVDKIQFHTTEQLSFQMEFGARRDPSNKTLTIKLILALLFLAKNSEDEMLQQGQLNCPCLTTSEDS